MEKITLKCHSCSFEKEFEIGWEEGEDSLDDAMYHFKGKNKLHIRSLQKKHKIDHFECGYEIYACSKSMQLRSNTIN